MRWSVNSGSLVLTRKHFELIKRHQILKARDDFSTFRRLISPKEKRGWFQKDLELNLMQWWYDFKAGKRPKLLVLAPPQHGKTSTIVAFIAWVSGQDPNLRTIYASVSERLGVRANKNLQRIYDREIYKDIFPETKISERPGVSGLSRFARNSELIEYIDTTGYFRNTTVAGSIVGESLDVGVVDDPIKGRKEAGSLTVRNSAWDWLTDDFFTRFSEHAGMIMILTRWHIDDPAGRLIKSIPDDIKVLTYKAIADEDEEHRNNGEALFHDLKSLDFLNTVKANMDSANFQSLYQCSPVQRGGNIIKGAWFGRYDVQPIYDYRIIVADTALKAGRHNDYTVFQCWGKKDGKIYLIDQLRGKWDALELERLATDFIRKHHVVVTGGHLRYTAVEDKASGTELLQRLKHAGFAIKAIPRNKDKFARLMDVVSYIESGFVVLPNKDFTSDFIAECEAFTPDNKHKHDDQIDPMIDAIELMLRDNSGFFIAGA